jgi:hypothetical protein
VKKSIAIENWRCPRCGDVRLKRVGGPPPKCACCEGAPVEEKKETTKRECKHWIDNASYDELWERWLSEPKGSPYRTGAMGLYFQEVMQRRFVGTMGHAENSDARHKAD